MTRAALYFAALLAGALLWRAPSAGQRSIALGLAALLALDVTRPFLAACPALYVAGFVAFYAAQTWTVERTLTPSCPRTGQAFTVLAACSGAALRLGVTAELARASFALSLAAQVLAVLRFVFRGKPPDDAQRVALILAASSFADLAGPWRAGSPGDLWYVQNITSVLTWAAIAGWEIRCLTRAHR